MEGLTSRLAYSMPALAFDVEPFLQENNQLFGGRLIISKPIPSHYFPSTEGDLKALPNKPPTHSSPFQSQLLGEPNM